MQSCREALDNLNRKECGNASLLMARYLRTPRSEDDSADARDLFRDMRHAAKNAVPLYTLAFERRDKTLEKTGAFSRCFKTVGPMVIGLGGSNVLETGLTLNPTYGTPMLPASSLKGITAHYCSEVLGAENPDYRAGGPIHEALFGTDSTAEEQNAGYLCFYDAWMMPEDVPGAFVDDVMTPHHADYYSGKAGADRPTDFDDPNPVTFLTLKGSFKVWLACEEPNEAARSEWLEFAHKLVRAALENYGVGGKIRSGYGKMEVILSKEEQARQKEAEEERKRQEAAKAAQQANAEAGFTHAAGDIVMIRCTKVLVKKGKEKREFAFEEGADGKTPRFQEPPKVAEGTVFKAQIERIDRSNNVYMLKTVE